MIFVLKSPEPKVRCSSVPSVVINLFRHLCGSHFDKLRVYGLTRFPSKYNIRAIHKFKKNISLQNENKFWLVLAISIAMAVFGSCRDNNSNISAEGINLNKDASYALGMSIGSDFKENIIASGIIPDMDEFLKGIRDVMTDKKTRFNVMEAEEIINHAFSSIMQDRNAAAAQEEITFLAENSRKPGVRITSSGLQYEIITEGSGQKPSFNSTVVVHYEGSLIDGTVFDSSYSRGSPAELPLDRVIPGWSEGLQLMNIGSQYIFYIPSEIGYGPGCWGPIPPFATLIFVVDLIDIIN